MHWNLAIQVEIELKFYFSVEVFFLI